MLSESATVSQLDPGKLPVSISVTRLYDQALRATIKSRPLATSGEGWCRFVLHAISGDGATVETVR